MSFFLTALIIVVSLLLVLVVLVQRGRGGGLSGAFGMGGGSQSAFGTKTGDVFTTITVVLFAVFMIIAIWLNLRVKNEGATASIPGALAPVPTASQPADAPVAPVIPAPATTPAQ